MNAPRRITTAPQHLKPETFRECYLVHKRANGGLTASEHAELLMIQNNARRQQAAADFIHDMATEARSRQPRRANPHGE